jgi:hypothetical protein
VGRRCRAAILANRQVGPTCLEVDCIDRANTLIPTAGKPFPKHKRVSRRRAGRSQNKDELSEGGKVVFKAMPCLGVLCASVANFWKVECLKIYQSANSVTENTE